MPEWVFREEHEKGLVRVTLYRDGERAGHVYGTVKKLTSDESYFELNYFEIDKRFQAEFLREKGLKLGETVFLEFLRMLKRENIGRRVL